MASSCKPQSRTYSKRIKPGEWETQKSKICELFLNRGHKLETVAKLMNEDGFTATVKQYKDRLRIWGVRKNRSLQSQVAARQRGQQNAVIVGSHELDIGSLPQSSAAIEEYKDISNAEMLPHIQCLTPQDLLPLMVPPGIQNMTPLEPIAQNEMIQTSIDICHQSDSLFAVDNDLTSNAYDMDLDTSFYLETHTAGTCSPFGTGPQNTSNINLIPAQAFENGDSQLTRILSSDWNPCKNHDDSFTNIWERSLGTPMEAPVTASQDLSELIVDSTPHLWSSNDCEFSSNALSTTRNIIPASRNGSAMKFTLSGSLKDAASSMGLLLSVLQESLEERNSVGSMPLEVSRSISWIQAEYIELLADVASKYSKALKSLPQLSSNSALIDNSFEEPDDAFKISYADVDAHLKRRFIGQKSPLACYNAVTNTGNVVFRFSRISRVESFLELRTEPDSSLLTVEISFFPKANSLRTGFSAKFGRNLEPAHNSPKLMPHLSTFNIVEFQSPVVVCVRKGDLKGLKELLGSGQASLHDRCQSGETLLAVSVFSDQLHMTRFLLQQGADSDECDQFGNTVMRMFDMRCGLLSAPTCFELYQLLLNPQCDADSIFAAEFGPFPSIYYKWFSALRDIREDPRFDHDDLLIHLNQALMPDLEVRNKDGCSILLQTLRSFANRGDFEDIAVFVEYLLSQGADAQTKDNIGNSALHILLSYPESSGVLDRCRIGCRHHHTDANWWNYLLYIRRFLKDFLELGCDPASKNDFGYTPSDIALWHPHMWEIWCSVLEAGDLSLGEILEGEDHANSIYETSGDCSQQHEANSYDKNMNGEDGEANENKESEEDKESEDGESEDEESEDEESEDEESEDEESEDDKESEDGESEDEESEDEESEDKESEDEESEDEETECRTGCPHSFPFDIWVDSHVRIESIPELTFQFKIKLAYTIPSLKTDFLPAKYYNRADVPTYALYYRQRLDDLTRTRPFTKKEDNQGHITWKDFSERKWKALQLHNSNVL